MGELLLFLQPVHHLRERGRGALELLNLLVHLLFRVGVLGVDLPRLGVAQAEPHPELLAYDAVQESLGLVQLGEVVLAFELLPLWVVLDRRFDGSRRVCDLGCCLVDLDRSPHERLSVENLWLLRLPSLLALRFGFGFRAPLGGAGGLSLRIPLVVVALVVLRIVVLVVLIT